MFSVYKKLFSFLVFAFIMVSCTEKEEQIEVKKEQLGGEVAVVEKSPQQLKGSVTQPALDIMKPLVGSDPCFEAVELLRDEGDVQTFRDLGESIILGDKEPATDSHRTYFSIIGGMLNEKKSIPEIRQKLLDACRAFKKKQKK